MRHQAIKYYIPIATITALTLLSACQDDDWYIPTPTNYKNEIQFTSTIKNEADAITTRGEDEKGSSDGTYSYYDTRKCENSDIYLITTAEDYIDDAQLGEKGEETTRAAEVTKNDFYHGFEASAYTYEYSTSDIGFSNAMRSGKVAQYINKTYVPISSMTDGKATGSAAGVYWTAAKYYMQFFAIAPSRMSSNNDIETYTVSWQYTPIKYEVEVTPNADDPTKNDTIVKIVNGDPIPMEMDNYNTYDGVGTGPYIDYVVPQWVKYQKDIVYASTHARGDGSDCNKTVNLTFKHALTAVKVQLNADKGFGGKIITNVTFKNVALGGRFYVVNDSEWQYPTSAGLGIGERSMTLDKTKSADIQYIDTNSVSGDSTFMMIPQKLGTDATIEVTVATYDATTKTISDDAKTYTGSLGSQIWRPGRTVTYQLSDDSNKINYYLDIPNDEVYFSWKGTPAGYASSDSTTFRNISFNSYFKEYDSNGAIISEGFVPWKAEVISETNPKYNVLTNTFSLTNSSTTNNMSVNTSSPYLSEFMVKGVECTTSTGYQEVNSDDYTKCRNNSTVYVGSESAPINLTSQGTTAAYPTSHAGYNSANCYVINKPGWYALLCTPGNMLLSTSASYINDKSYVLGNNYDKVKLTSGSTIAMGYAVLNSGFDESSSHSGNYYLPYSDIAIVDPWQIYYGNGNDYLHGYSYSANKGTNLKPCIKTGDKNYSSYKPSVLWEDVKGLITNISAFQVSNYDGNKYGQIWLKFFVGYNKTFEPGNAVIQLRNEHGYVIWSWHIWCTSINVGVTPTSCTADLIEVDKNPKYLSGKTSKFLRVPLGYVEEKYKHYNRRESKLLITQTDASGNALDGGKKDTITLVQEEHWHRPKSCTYYQWGRKDPFPGFLVSEAGDMDAYGNYSFKITEKTIYDGDGNATSIKYCAVPSNPEASNKVYGTTGYGWVQMGIANPGVFYTGQWWCTNNFFDLWGCKYNYFNSSTPRLTKSDVTNRKTVYDPCPYGFRVPSVIDFPALSKDGGGYAYKTAETYYGLTDLSKASTPVNEEEMFAGYINTPYKNHKEAINNFGYEFYCKNMTSGLKDVNGKTFMLYAFGKRNAFSGAPAFGQGGRFDFHSATKATNGTGDGNGHFFFMHTGYGGNQVLVMPIGYNTATAWGMPIMALYEEVDDR